MPARRTCVPRCRQESALVFFVHSVGARQGVKSAALIAGKGKPSPGRRDVSIDIGRGWRSALRHVGCAARGRTGGRQPRTVDPRQPGGALLGHPMDVLLGVPRGEPSPIYPRRYTAILGRVGSPGGPRPAQIHSPPIPCALAVEVAEGTDCQFVRCHPVRFCRSCPLALSSVSLLLSYPVRSCPILST